MKRSMPTAIEQPLYKEQQKLPVSRSGISSPEWSRKALICITVSRISMRTSPPWNQSVPLNDENHRM